MKIAGLSDLHGYLPDNIPTCEVLCISGDIIPLQIQRKSFASIRWWLRDFCSWVCRLPCEKVIFTTVYPQYSLTTVEACFNRLAKLYNISGNNKYKSVVIPYWYENEKYCTAISKRILDAAKKLNKDIKDCHVLYSAHSVPLSYVEKGDPYPEHVKHHTEIINKMTGIKSFETAYQSKVGPVKWLHPTMIETLESYKEKNIDNIIIVPISFISDHIETLIELDEQLIPILKNAGKNIVRIESLNDSPDFIEALSNIITI